MKREIQRYARANCATFTQSDRCLIEPGGELTCVYFREWPDDGMPRCRYFEQAVLPADPALEKRYWNKVEGIEDELPDDVANCSRCGKSFVKQSNAAKYCDRCRMEARKETNRKSQRRHRSKKG